MRSISLKARTFMLLVSVVLFAAIPLIVYYIAATQGMGELGTDTNIERSLRRSIDNASDDGERREAAEALKKYGQFSVLKDRIVRQVIAFSVMYSAVVIACALFIGYILISRITRPLETLIEAARHLGNEDLDYRISAQADGEIGRLIAAFNAMAGDLKIARQRQAIAERRATWQHVARTIAHEIKNPLTPIKLSTERMYDKYLNNSPDFGEVIRSTTTVILNEIANLQRLIDTFHRYAKFPDPVLRLESLTAVVREAAALFGDSTVKVVCETADAPIILPLDKNQMKEALSNLIKNGCEAVEATGRTDGFVRVECRRAHDRAVVNIADNGCGISASNQKKLFQPYFTTKKHGNGIGCALTERIVSLHGGTISFQSAEGKGTIFTISFPLGKKEDFAGNDAALPPRGEE